ncbi:PNG1 protein [Apiospora sp. TS-2023a]
MAPAGHAPQYVPVISQLHFSTSTHSPKSLTPRTWVINVKSLAISLLPIGPSASNTLALTQHHRKMARFDAGNMVVQIFLTALGAMKIAIMPPVNVYQSPGPPKNSCGRRIITSQLKGSKKAWYALGTARDIFERDIEPCIWAAVRNTEPGDADIYYQLYMIGKQPDTSRPTLMICCEVSQVRVEVESSIRQNGILNQHPEFDLQTSSLLLELPAPIRLLGGHQRMESSPDPNDTKAPEDLQTSGNQIYLPAPIDLLSGHQRMGSLGCLITNLDASGRQRFSTGGVVVQVGSTLYQMTATHARDESNPWLGYALLPLESQTTDFNVVRLQKLRLSPRLRVKDVKDIPSRPRKVVAVTGSSGVIHGSLYPEPTYLRPANCFTVQKLYTVELKGVVVQGDCGSVVLDRDTGTLYGHIVRGCPNSGIVYIIPATDIFRGIKKRFGKETITIGRRAKRGFRDRRDVWFWWLFWVSCLVGVVSVLLSLVQLCISLKSILKQSQDGFQTS